MTVTQKQATFTRAELIERRNQELKRVTQPDTQETTAEPKKPDNRFEHLAGFVEWSQTITTKPPGVPMAWCPRWEQHPRERAVLSALWGAYEKVKEDPVEYLSWLQDRFMPLMEEMIEINGPLSSCRTNHTEPIELGAANGTY